ncbi:N-acetylmuramoyl-L-alanine amidase [Antricoccus suffuscus]|uniref:N-acetylmuramoyl-L-alanine amidase n=2 Tax=Antricoccus suffuscus TaxID=1629062 RepID=A0A2T1A6Z3_9ACTN|nr:N-acetylmuramoyl-L-alanine amidase [Antricoccus suffuscus]
MVLAQPNTKGFSMAGVTWAGDNPTTGLAVQIRVKDTEKGTWSGWTDLSLNQDGGPNPNAAGERNGTDPYWFGTSDGIEISVTIAPGVNITDAKLTLIDPKKISQDGNPGAPQPAAQAHGAPGDQPLVYTRAQWGADESKRTWDPQYASTIKAATLHHSADGNNYSEADVPGIMRSIYQYQAVTQGWGDIGYNVVVDKFGRAWEGRYGGLASTVIGAHAGGFNTYTFGVSMLGNYDLVDVPAATKETVAQLIAWKFGLYGVNPTGTTQLTQMNGGFTTAKFNDGQTVTLNTIFGHRDTGNTVCPGRYGYAALPSIRARVAQIMSSYPAFDPQGAMSTGAGTNGEIAINGWAFDGSAPYGSATVMFTLNGQVAGYASASGPRPELGNYGIPGNHGFTTTLKPSSTGSDTVCMFIFNLGNGKDVLAQCSKVVIPKINPQAAFTATKDAAGLIHADGWAIDMSAPMEPTVVMLTLDGAAVSFSYANGPRPELANYGIPGNHGLNTVVQGSRTSSNLLCMYVFNIGAGSDILAGCLTLAPPPIDPQGAMQAGVDKSGNIVVDGWAFDLSDPTAAATVMLTSNGQAFAFLYADQPRPELANYGVPGNHGFVYATKPSKGSSQVCMYVFNIGGGADRLVGCATVKV